MERVPQEEWKALQAHIRLIRERLADPSLPHSEREGLVNVLNSLLSDEIGFAVEYGDGSDSEDFINIEPAEEFNSIVEELIEQETPEEYLPPGPRPSIPTTFTELVETVEASAEEKALILDVLPRQVPKFETLKVIRSPALRSLRQIPQNLRDKLWDAIQRFQQQPEDFTLWTTEDIVGKWLAPKGWQKYGDNFRRLGITGLSLVLLTEDDLEDHLGVEILGDRAQMIDELNHLRRLLPGAMEKLVTSAKRMQQNHAVLSVPFQDLDQDLFIKKARWWDQMVTLADTEVYSPVIAFAGPTASGKSRLIAELLPFHARINQRIPIVAKEGQRQSTTGDIALYRGSLTAKRLENPPNRPDRSVFLLDLEGENGNLPEALEKELGGLIATLKGAISRLFLQDSDAQLRQRVKRVVDRRMAFVKEELPKLAYLVSNVVIYVDRQPMHNKNYIERVIDFSRRLSPGMNASDKPHLVLVQNFCTDGNAQEYELEKSRADFLVMLQENGGVDGVDEILNNFSSVAFIKIPDANRDPSLFGEQVMHFQDYLLEQLNRTHSFTLDADNFFSEYHWFLVVEAILVSLRAKKQSINMATIFSHVCKPKEKLLRKAQDFFNIIYDTLYQPPDAPDFRFWYGDSMQAFQRARMDTFLQCVEATLFKMAELFVLEWKEKKTFSKVQHLEKKKVEEMLRKHFGLCLKMLCNRAPCTYLTQSSVCVHEKLHHGNRHRLFSPLIVDLIKRVTWAKEGEGDYCSPEGDWDTLYQKFLQHTKAMIELELSDFHKCRVKNLGSLFAQHLSHKQRIKELYSRECLLCLNRSAHSLLTCGHTFCQRCNRLSEKCYGSKFACPVCHEQVELVDISKKLPRLARPRILSLDGGGVRAVVPLVILAKVEERLNLAVPELFDMIAGTSAGAILAAGLAVKRLSLKDCQAFYSGVAKKLFPSGKSVPMVLWNLMVGPYYDINNLRVALRETFGDTTLLDAARSDGPKILVVATDFQDTRPYLFGSFASSEVDWQADLTEALVASAAAPTYFRHVDYKDKQLVDGGVCANNPSLIASRRALSLWHKHPALMLSLGTGRAIVRKKDFKPGKLSDIVRMILHFALDSERIEKESKAWCKENSVLYVRLNVDGLGHIGLDDASSAVQKQLVEKTEAYCMQEALLLDEVALTLMAQVFFIDDEGTGEEELKFFIRPRVRNHFSFSQTMVSWKDKGGGHKEAQLEVSMVDSTGMAPALRTEVAPDGEGWLVIMSPCIGEYTVKANLVYEEQRYGVSGSPCMLWLEKGGDTFIKTLALKRSLQVIISQALLMTSASFCTVKYGRSSKETRHLEPCTDPQWMSTSEFGVKNSLEDRVEITLFRSPSEPLGSIVVPLDEVEVGRRITRWHMVHKVRPASPGEGGEKEDTGRENRADDRHLGKILITMGLSEEFLMFEPASEL